MIGHTTDGIGFMQSVSDAGHDITGKKMTLLGAGGAATAICTQAALDGVSDIDIFRLNTPGKFEKTAAFAKTVCENTNCSVTVYDYTDTNQMRRSIEESSILVNATSVGMAPDEESCPIPDRSMLYPGLCLLYTSDLLSLCHRSDRICRCYPDKCKYQQGCCE